MSDAFADVAKMKNIKEAIKAHEGQLVELTLENGRKREKNKIGRLTEVYSSLFIVEYQDFGSQADAINNSYVESYTYSDILTEKTLIRYLSPEEQAEIENNFSKLTGNLLGAIRWDDFLEEYICSIGDFELFKKETFSARFNENYGADVKQIESHIFGIVKEMK